MSSATLDPLVDPDADAASENEDGLAQQTTDESLTDIARGKLPKARLGLVSSMCLQVYYTFSASEGQVAGGLVMHLSGLGAKGAQHSRIRDQYSHASRRS